MHDKTNIYQLFILMLMVIIEVMGMGLVLPILPELLLAKTSPLFVAEHSDLVNNLLYGAAISVWPLGMFFGTPLLGDLSDRLGRKKIFIICLLFTALCYSFCAFAIYLHSVWMFLFCRFLAGFFAGSYDISQAAVADLSTHQTKARNMGWLTFAFALGFIVGPLITSFTASSNIVSWFGITTPFWIACGMAIFNALLLFCFFQETLTPKTSQRIDFTKAFSSFMFIYRDPRVVYLGIVFCLTSSGWYTFLTGVPLILAKNQHFSTYVLGWYFFIIGAGSIITILFVQPFFLRHFTLKKIVYDGVIIAGGLMLLLATNLPVIFFWIIVFIFTIIELLIYSSFLALASNAVTTEEQGKTMGGFAAVGSIAFLGTGMMIAWCENISIFLPPLVAALGYFVSAYFIRPHS